MTKTEYLYDIDVKEISELQLKLANIKIKAAKKLVNKLQKPHFKDRDYERLNKVLDAIKWNEKLIQEIGESR